MKRQVYFYQLNCSYAVKMLNFKEVLFALMDMYASVGCKLLSFPSPKVIAQHC